MHNVKSVPFGNGPDGSHGLLAGFDAYRWWALFGFLAVEISRTRSLIFDAVSCAGSWVERMTEAAYWPPYSFGGMSASWSSTWNEVCILFCILLAAFLIRAIPRVQLPHAISADGYWHLAIARFIRENGRRFIYYIPRNIVRSRYSYPAFYHWVLSFFSCRGAEWAERYGSAITDVVHTSWLFIFAMEVLALAGFGSDVTRLSLWSAVLFALSPALLRVGTGPRAYHGTPRTIGQLLFALFMGGVILYSLGGSIVYLVIAVISVIPLSITSKFANQAIVFISVLVALLGNPCAAVAALTGYAISILVTRGETWRVLVDQTLHSSYYFRRVQGVYLNPAQRGLRDYLRSILGALASPFVTSSQSVSQHSDLRSTSRALAHSWSRKVRFFCAHYWIERYWAHVLVAAYPQIPLLIILLIANPDLLTCNGPQCEVVKELGRWVLASLICTVVTAHRPFLFLGEAERYSEMTVMAQIALFAVIVSLTGWGLLLPLLLIYSVIAYWFFISIFETVFGPSEDLYNNLLPLVRRNDSPGKLFYALGTLHRPVLYALENGFYAIYSGNVHEKLVDIEEVELLFGRWPYPSAKIETLIERFGFDYIVACDPDIKIYESLLGDDCFTGKRLRLIDTQGEFGIYGRR